jgi:feruloyl-CoA synthase
MKHGLDDPALLAPARTVRIAFDDGSFVLRSPEPLKPYARCVGDWLERWARETPDAPAFAERRPPGAGSAGAAVAAGAAGPAGEWRRLTWRQAREQVGRVAQSLLDLDLPRHAPVVVLSDNSLDHLLLMLATMHIGRAVCTVSSAYCRLTKDYTKVHGILNTLGPALVYADNPAVYGAAIASSGLRCPVVFSRGAAEHAGAIAFERLLQPAESAAVKQAYESITPDVHAKYLLTSGSTGHPKVVINTHRMLCANQQMVAQAWRFLEREKPVIVDWLPWSHTFGGNHNLNMVMRNGGTLAVDEGRPAPGLVDRTVANIAEVQPNIWLNVPRGFDLALPLLEADAALARRFFERMRAVFYAGAALPQASWERLQKLASRVRGEPVWMTTSWGSTETSPAVTSAHWWLDRAGNIGIPLPGVELKFVPAGDKLEMRVRGVNVFPGYRDAPHLTARAFDEEGYYCIGDAGYLVDGSRPERGVVFDGRVAEDFKLSSGTWVSVGMLRIRVVSALAPLAQDVVVTGHDRDDVGVLVFPAPQAAGLPADELAARVRSALRALKAEGGGSSQTPTRALVLAEPPSADAGEITDKGYLNQGAVLQRRADKVAALYAGGPGVIVAD